MPNFYTVPVENMKQKNLLSRALLSKICRCTLVLITVGTLISCVEKDKAVICTETCCDTFSNRYQYITEIKEAEANYANEGFWLKNPVNGINSIMICPLSMDKVSGFTSTFNPKDLQNLPFSYRISGKSYDNIDDIPLGKDQIYNIRLEKAIKVK